eukprot:7693298-Pyramimonas_sp.AAC.1
MKVRPHSAKSRGLLRPPTPAAPAAAGLCALLICGPPRGPWLPTGAPRPQRPAREPPDCRAHHCEAGPRLRSGRGNATGLSGS